MCIVTNDLYCVRSDVIDTCQVVAKILETENIFSKDNDAAFCWNIVSFIELNTLTLFQVV